MLTNVKPSNHKNWLSYAELIGCGTGRLLELSKIHGHRIQELRAAVHDMLGTDLQCRDENFVPKKTKLRGRCQPKVIDVPSQYPSNFQWWAAGPLVASSRRMGNHWLLCLGLKPQPVHVQLSLWSGSRKVKFRFIVDDCDYGDDELVFLLLDFTHCLMRPKQSWVMEVMCVLWKLLQHLWQKLDSRVQYAQQYAAPLSQADNFSSVFKLFWWMRGFHVKINKFCWSQNTIGSPRVAPRTQMRLKFIALP